MFIDTPYEIKMSPIEELPKSHIDIYFENENKIRKYHDIESEKSFRTWELASFNIYRIYTISDIERVKLIPYAKKLGK